jgi:hypothetical protein
VIAEVEVPFAVIDVGDAEIVVVDADTAPGATVNELDATDVVKA